MCGINAIYDCRSTAAARSALVDGMNRQMRYRGPDGDATFSDGGVTIGMCRLSIVDLAGGMQPLFNEDKTIALVCNGEIYNHVELRAGLSERGHRFATNSDCEPIVHLYEERGEDCVDALRGMFAFALWDSRAGRLFVARDPLGVKPLYVARKGPVVGVSSELKALVRAGIASSTIDYDTLFTTLRHTYPIDPVKTVARDVTRLPPGTALTIDSNGVRQRTYWRLRRADGSSVPSHAPSDDDLLREFEETVRIHLRADVAVAVLLSAGLDSAAITAMARRSTDRITALCAGYVGAHECDERGGAHATAGALGVEYVDLELDVSEFPRLFEELTRCCDEPACDVSSAAQWALYRACSDRGYRVVLSGIGGDELFFGYPDWNAVGQLLDRRRSVRQSASTAAFAAVLDELGDRAPRLRERFGWRWPGRWTGINRGMVSTNQRALRWLGADPGGRQGAAVDRAVLQMEGGAARGPDAVYAFLTDAYLARNGLQLADKLGMGCSVEVRVPMADHVFFERVCGLPLARRFSLAESKPLLKRMIKGALPVEVLGRPKQGFTPPGAFINSIIRAQADRILENDDLRAWLKHDRLVELVRSVIAASAEGGAVRRPAAPSRSFAALNGSFRPLDLSWLVYSLAAFVASRDQWNR